MEELQSVAIVGIIFGVIYKLFELFIGQKERLLLIEKFGDSAFPENLRRRLPETGFSFPFKVLRSACLLLGLGFGLLAGYGILSLTQPDYFTSYVNARILETGSVVYGACILFGGGLGLLVAYLIEVKSQKK